LTIKKSKEILGCDEITVHCENGGGYMSEFVETHRTAQQKE
jgi:hypothetical protein